MVDQVHSRSEVEVKAGDERSRYVVGIDLGTSNSALAFVAPGVSKPQALDIPQLDAPGMVGRHKTLPSALYIPHQSELDSADTKLPWEQKGREDVVVGRWARERGAQVPERYVASAKSWLCNTHVNRYEKILPWHSQIEGGKHSPLQASRLYIEHLKAAFEDQSQTAGQRAELGSQDVVLTVPASFDEVARTLTYEAAVEAGLANVTLLEEPLAAFYAWIAAAGDDWRKQVHPGDVVLVCDVGGGTCDFSLIAVSEDKGQLRLERISVGDHLLLGGDNMDLALAYMLRAQLENEGHNIDHWQFLSLVSAAQIAKEALLSDPSLDAAPVGIMGRGASLFAQTISTSLHRVDAERILLEGFFPLTQSTEMPSSRRMSGIQEFGLNYETDAAISRHLARFLRRSRENVMSNSQLTHLASERLSAGETLLMPTAVLFNGGVFNSEALRSRVLELLRGWNRGEGLRELIGERLDLAVAFGAAYYGQVRASGKGIRVQSGTARSYYIGLESPVPAVPGIEPPVKGLCLVPQGTEEGTELELPEKQFGLVVGEPVEFRFFSSSVRAGDTIGTTVDYATRELEESTRLSIMLPAEGARDGEVVPVRLDAEVTSVGTLKLFMKHVGSDQRWNLEFNVRPHEDA